MQVLTFSLSQCVSFYGTFYASYVNLSLQSVYGACVKINKAIKDEKDDSTTLQCHDGFSVALFLHAAPFKSSAATFVCLVTTAKSDRAVKT